MTVSRFLASTTLLAGLLATAIVPAATPDPRKEAEAVVQAFNAAFAKKDVEAVVSHVIPGGVKFDLKPAHADQGADHKIVQELQEHWYGVAPVLFGAVQSYTRKAEIIDTHAGPDTATVWARMTTEMLAPKAPKASVKTFTEVYFLVRTPQGWKIGAMMDDRATDNLTTGMPPKK
ncbi:MAG: hypothetical protein IT486_05365 [Gammaproteobacteria bacterium]|nr:hypothetical protein [Gammaproteobacteria bacterium]